MPRSINASVITELATNDFEMVSLLFLDFDFPSSSPTSNPVYLTEAPFDVTYDSNTYLSSANILSIGDVSETGDLRVGTLGITMSGAEQTYVSLFLNNDYIDTRVVYYRAFMDSSRAIIGEPLVMFDGRISGVDINDNGGKSTVTIECASHWANFDAISGRKTNDNSQQAFFSGDLGMEFASHTVKDVRWGAK